jgi:hypothetical protein
MAAARPLTIGIGLESRLRLTETGRAPLALQFRERDAEKRLLGEIGLRLRDIIPARGDQVCLFETRNCRNNCMPRARLWARYLHYGYHQWRSRKQVGSNVPMVGREVRCLFVFYICPRPVVLVSVLDGDSGNIFPMDLIGPVGCLRARQESQSGVPHLGSPSIWHDNICCFRASCAQVLVARP